jgi:hypothetical protein
MSEANSSAPILGDAHLNNESGGNFGKSERSDGKDFERAAAAGLHCDVHEGDALYIPSGWYHSVYSTPSVRPDLDWKTEAVKTTDDAAAPALPSTLNIGINYWFREHAL